MLSIIKRAFVALPKGFSIFLILFVILVVFNFINLSVTPVTGEIQLTTTQATVILLNCLVLILVTAFVNGGVLCFFKDLIKTGSADVKNFIQNGKRYFPKMLAMIAIIILIGLAIGLLGSWFTFLFEGKVIARIIVTIAQFLAGVLIAFPIYALVADDKGVIESFFNAIKKSVNNYPKVLLLLVILLLVLLAFVFIAGFIIGILQLFIKGVAINILMAILMAVVVALWMFLSMEALMDYYLQLQASETQTSGTQRV